MPETEVSILKSQRVYRLQLLVFLFEEDVYMLFEYIVFILDMSSPVCLFCGSRYTANVYLLDITKKEMRQLDVDVSQPIRFIWTKTVCH